MLLKPYGSAEVDCRTWLYVPYGTLWSSNSDTHQVDIYKKDFFSNVRVILNRI